jgi:hypothetical protein
MTAQALPIKRLLIFPLERQQHRMLLALFLTYVIPFTDHTPEEST